MCVECYSPLTVFADALANPITDVRDHLPFFRSMRGTVLEIGVRGGVSTSAFLLGLEEAGYGHLYSVDIDAQCAVLFEHPQWTFIHASSRDVTKVLMDLPLWVDVLFVDGDHSFEGVLHDLETYSKIVRPGGLILAHDVWQMRPAPWIEGVRPAFMKFVSETGWDYEIVEKSWGLGIIKKPEAQS